MELLIVLFDSYWFLRLLNRFFYRFYVNIFPSLKSSPLGRSYIHLERKVYKCMFIGIHYVCLCVCVRLLVYILGWK